MTFAELLEMATDINCSDIHITVGNSLDLRRFGELRILEPAPSAEESKQMIYSILSEDQRRFVDAGNDLDVGVMLPDGRRIRANVYHQRNNLACSIRILEQNIPSFAELGLPNAIKDMAETPRGLVLVTGPTGSGKSTTLASMVAYINKTRARHIITIEDPIEYVYPYNKAMIHQREVGRDVDNFSSALRSALREDPDIILVGEMRDFETIQAAISAAETGHLVLSTLHTTSAAQTIERIIDACPLEGRDQIRNQFSNVIRGVFTQQLLQRSDGQGRVLASEVMIGTPAITNLIRENKTLQIPAMMQAGRSAGMRTMNDDLANLIRQDLITKEEGYKVSPDASALRKILAGT